MWKFLTTVNVAERWQFSPVVEGTYFRVKTQTSAKLPYDFDGLIAQAEVALYTTLHDVQMLEPSREAITFTLPQPRCFEKRAIAVRQSFKYPKPVQWSVSIEYWQFKPTDLYDSLLIERENIITSTDEILTL